jgi:chromosome segregation ATPase
MSHGEGRTPDDPYYMDPKEVLAQYSVEWVSLRKSLAEVKAKLSEVQAELSELDIKLERKEITEQEHMDRYHDKWLMSTQIVQVKREVESRLFEIQKEIRKVNKEYKQQEEERLRKERIEQERSNAMIEWMSLKQGFELVKQRRNEINSEMDQLEIKRRKGSIAEGQYRNARVEQIRKLAELSIVESDVKGRLAELLEIIRG